MNKHLHRIVFNKARGLLMVVAETVSSHGQPATEAACAPAPQTALTTAALRPICFSLLLAGGLVLSQMEMAQAQIVADPSAPRSQQPTILNTANGVPQINIQTPSAAGVSRNTYSQFDVDRQGAILNNARNSAQTQLGGWVQGNPWLAGGTARIILNEVNASNPSQLRGYVEVAGDRAQVVIANPAGISCDGCGFINANRATLTTGSAVLNGGSLEGYRVQQGNIVVSGAGMDGRQTDYTDLIARSVQLNAGIWANKLQVNTGASQVSADLSQSTALTPAAPAPQYLLDVASLGGMYAGKITLVGNEHGVGMRQAGQVGATAGDVVVTQDGHLENSGKISASGNLQVSTTGNVLNTGSMVASGNASVDASQAQISNQAGAILGANGNVDLHAASISNSGSLISAGLQLSVQADTLDNQQTQNTAQGLQAQSISITTAQLNNQHGQILADHALSVQSSGGLDNTAGLISSAQSVSLQDTQPSKTLAITNTGGTVQAVQQLTIASSSLSGDGTVQSTGNLAINLQGDFTNTGTVQASGTASLNTTGKISNQSTLSANSTLQLAAANLENTASGTINAGTTQLDITNTLNNRGLIDGENTWLSAATLNNLGTGRIYGTQLALSASTLNNDVESGTAATIASRDRLDLGVGTLNNKEHALIFSNSDMAIGGSLDANHHAAGSATTLNNNSASIEALGNLSLAATTINNTNEHFATAILPVGSTQSIVEYQGSGSPNRYTPGTPGVYIYNDESDHLMTPEGSFESWIKYEYSRNTQASTVTQTDPGSISAGGSMQIAANSLINDKSHIVAGGVLTATVQDLQNREVTGQQIVTDNGGVTSYWRNHQKGRDDTGSSWAAYNPAPVITDISLATVKFQQNTAPTASTTQIASLSSSSVNTQPTSILQLAANNSLFHLTSNPQLGYLVETDQRFANYKNWLSSDYLLQALAVDPATVQKRLGDGFYEQKLLREQVAQLTGRRFLDGYSNDEVQYRALLEQGATVAKAWNLRPGVALTAQQISQLTSDIVWLVEKDVTLPNGTVTKALVPQLYVQVKPGDLNGNGALIAGNALDLKLSGTLDNQGSIAGRSVVSLTANTVNNLGGRITGQDVAVSAATDLNVIGGHIDAANSLQATAGNDLNVTTTTRSNSNAQGSVTNLNRLAGLYVTNPTGATLVASAGHDLNLAAAEISNTSSGGNTVLAAGNNLNLTTVSTGNQQSIVWDGNNRRQDSTSQEVGSQVNTSGNSTLLAGNNLDARAATITSDQGALRVQAGNDIKLTAGTSRQTVDEAHQHRGTSSAFSSTTTTTWDRLDQTQAVATTLSGNTTDLQAGHDIAVTGSNVVSTERTTLQAGHDIAITAATTTSQEQHDKQQVTSGLFSGGGIGFTLGTREQDIWQRSTSTGASAATIGSTNGSVTMKAGQHYQQTGSNVLAPNGNIDIAAKQIDIVEAHQTGTTRTDTLFKQSGLSVALTSPIISALQTGQQMKQAVTQTSDSRMQALAGATVALAGKNAYDAVSKDPAHAGGVNVSISIGASQNKSQTTNNHDGALGSTITAGGNATIRAHGDGQNSNLTVQGSDIKAAGNLTLQADNQIQLLAAQNSDSQHSTNSGSSASLGISFGTSGLLFTASASGSRGKADGTDTTWTNTHVDAGQQLTLQSGGDTTLKGAVASGKQMVADIGGNLKLESLQDTSHYDSKQQSLGGSISVGVGVVSGSLSASKSKINSDYASVTEQTGLKSGDGGFQVKVQGNTDLKGAVISSSEQAVNDNKNQFSTGGQLSLSDIQNKADYSGDSFGITLSGSNNKKESSLTPSGGGIGSDHGSASSTTRSGISGIAGNVSARTGDAPTGIAKIFDVDKVQKELNAQVKITQAFSQQAGQAVDNYVQKNRSALIEQMKKAQSSEERAALKSQMDDLTRQERVMNILIGAVTGQGGTAITKEGLSVAADQMRQLMLEDSAKFAGVTDGKTSYDNLSADSVGVRGDGKKLGGTRWDLDQLCGANNSRCLKTPDGQLQLDAQGRVQFDSSPEGANMSLNDFLKTEEGKKLAGATGGIQGVKGTLFGTPYEAGSWQDKLIESFAGTHDMIGGKFSGLYDEQGNAKRGRGPVQSFAQDRWSELAIPVAAPFAMAEALPPQVWNAISILLKAAK